MTVTQIQSPSVNTLAVKGSASTGTSGASAVFVGAFEKGPINEIVYCEKPIDFKQTFGRALDFNYNDWYQAYNYLQYNKGIYVIRTKSGSDWNASTLGKISSFQDYSFFESITEEIIRPEIFSFAARTPGTWGNDLVISIIGKADFDVNIDVLHGVHAKSLFSYFEENYYGIIVLRNGKPVETFYTLYEDAEEINNESDYIFIRKTKSELCDITLGYYDGNYFLFDGNDERIDGDTTYYSEFCPPKLFDGNYYLIDGRTSFANGNDAFITRVGEFALKLSGGEQINPTDGDLDDSYDLLRNPDDIELDIIIGNERNNNLSIALAELRRDCLAFVGVPADLVYRKDLSSIDSYIDNLQRSEFAHVTLNAKRQYDNFVSKPRTINIAGDIAGLNSAARMITPWAISSGLNRGVIKNSSSLILINDRFTKDLYKKGVNFCSKTAIMSQKTFTLDRQFIDVHIRSLFNHVEKQIRRTTLNSIFNQNDVNLRGEIARTIKNLLISVRAKNGINWGKVEVHQDGIKGIKVDIFIQPVGAVYYVQMRYLNNKPGDSLGEASIRRS